jgi:hypothetical protein
MIRRRNFRQIVAGLLLAMPFVFSSAHAHEVRPAYLEIKETVPGQFSLAYCGARRFLQACVCPWR